MAYRNIEPRQAFLVIAIGSCIHIIILRPVDLSTNIEPGSASPRGASAKWFPAFKEDRNPERGQPSGIERARYLRVDYVAFFLS